MPGSVSDCDDDDVIEWLTWMKRAAPLSATPA